MFIFQNKAWWTTVNKETQARVYGVATKVDRGNIKVDKAYIMVDRADIMLDRADIMVEVENI